MQIRLFISSGCYLKVRKLSCCADSESEKKLLMKPIKNVIKKFRMRLETTGSKVELNSDSNTSTKLMIFSHRNRPWKKFDKRR